MKAKCCGQKLINRTGLRPEDLAVIEIDTDTETDQPIALEELEKA